MEEEEESVAERSLSASRPRGEEFKGVASTLDGGFEMVRECDSEKDFRGLAEA